MSEPDRPPTAAERWERVDEILGRALDCPEAERPALLDEACAGDLELRREVEELLAAEAAAPTFLDDSAAGFVAEALVEEDRSPGLAPGSSLGEYRLIREIGAGGMSRVYLAERESGDFDQRVAIKVLRAVGLDAEHGLERFRFERMVLASLDHPHIARVLSGGATDAGLPYLVMEHVEGVPITSYCAKNRLGLTERLGLALDVCAAVQYAHQRLIVHRDLKPSNILVTEEGQAKLLDFGIAKLLDPESLGLGAGAPMTQTGLLLMTPDYAAPEQVLGAEVTTATDVYALGVLLYELLTGERPYRTHGRSAATIERLICEADPPAPSSSASGNADRERPIERGRLRGDLDAIVLKALRKEPEARYGSARELAADIESHLQGLPVAAGPTTFTYRARKFVRRHKLPVGVAVMFVLAIIGFGAVTAWQQAQTRRERDRARAAEAKANAINRFLIDDLLGSAAPEVAQGREITVRQVAERAEARLEGSFSGQPELEASIRRSLGEIHLGLGELEAAAEQLARAESLFESELGADHPETLEVRRLQAEVALTGQDFEGALEDLAEVAEAQRRTLGERDLRVRTTEGTIARGLIEAGEFDTAIDQLAATLEALEQDAPGAWRERLELLTLKARAHARRREWLEAEAVAAEALRHQLQHLGPDHPEVGKTLAVLGNAQTKNDRYDAAGESLEQALELQRRVLGSVHPDTLATLRLLSILAWDRGDVETSAIYVREEYDRALEVYGDADPRTLRALGMLAMLLDRSGRADQAKPILGRLVDVNSETLGPSHPKTIRALKNLNKFLLRSGETAAAREAMQRTLEVNWERLEEAGDDQTFLSDFAYLLVTCRPEDLRDPAAALPLAERAVELSGRQWDDALDTLAFVYRGLGRLDDAIEVQREALELPDAIRRGGMESLLVDMLVEKGDLAGAEAMLLWNLERRHAARPADDPVLGTSYRFLGDVRAKMGRLEEAEADLRRAVAQLEKTLDHDDPLVSSARSELGALLVRRQRFEEAETLLVEAAEALAGHGYFDWEARLRAQAFERVVDLYESWGRPAEAADWRERATIHRAW